MKKNIVSVAFTTNRLFQQRDNLRNIFHIINTKVHLYYIIIFRILSPNFQYSIYNQEFL